MTEATLPSPIDEVTPPAAAPGTAAADSPRAPAPAVPPARRRAALLAACVLALLCTVLAAAASRHTSPTFDEITTMAGGARAFGTGEYDMFPEHPPLMLYLYGLPVHLAQPNLPAARPFPDWRAGERDFTYRYGYAREFLWAVGNDPEAMAFRARLMAAVLAGVLVLMTFLFTRRFGDVPALLAAGLVAFLPDVLAHGGVAYNDLPLALLYLLAVWALDAAVRRPTPVAGALAGVAIALALGTKFSAVVLAPVAVALIALEAVARRGERRWLLQTGLAATCALATGVLTLVALYRGDFTLAEFRYGLDFTFGHVTEGHGAPGYLLGKTSVTGWWYFFPVAFLFKTPAGLHLLLLLALVGFTVAWRPAPLRALAAMPLRAPVVGLLLFLLALLTSNLNIGFRYALPLLPLLCIIVAVGVARLWPAAQTWLRGAVVLGAVAFAASSLAHYPYFLSYISEYGPGRGQGHRVLVDSSLDWGQGLLALRDWMREQGVPRVYLSYFGSGVPAGYGIEYVALPSFFGLRSFGDPNAPPPEYAAISATNLAGVYLPGDPLARFRPLEPVTTLAGGSILIYRVR